MTSSHGVATAVVGLGSVRYRTVSTDDLVSVVRSRGVSAVPAATSTPTRSSNLKIEEARRPALDGARRRDWLRLDPTGSSWHGCGGDAEGTALQIRCAADQLLAHTSRLRTFIRCRSD